MGHEITHGFDNAGNLFLYFIYLEVCVNVLRSRHLVYVLSSLAKDVTVVGAIM